jgi:hypothetical protein
MENIINLTYRLKELAELVATKETLAEMQTLNNEISSLLATQVAA